VGFDLGVKIITFGSRNLFRNTTILNDEELKEMGRFKEYDYDQQKDLLRKHWAESNISIGSVHFPEMELSVAGSGSNAWVIGGEHTKNGRPLLANDPHLASLIPSLFYCLEVVLLGENNQIVNKKFGVMADGIPSVSIGVGKEFAWGSTAAYIDTKDVYFETVRNNSGILQYLFKDEWHDFRERKELIKVRGGDDIEEIYYHTHRGVVISSIFLEMHWKYGFPLP
jgi:penicillin amidase